MSLGVALSVKANMGVSPISCIPYVYSLKSSFTLGELTTAFNIILILGQVAVLRKKYRIIQLIQLPVVFAFGVFIDFSLSLVSGLWVSNYAWQAFWCLLSCIVIALGVFLEVKANITYLPGEGLALAIAETFGKEFGKAKIAVDSSMVFIGIISSYVFLFRLQGIREGTVLAAVLVGFIAKFFGKKIRIADTWLNTGISQENIQSEDQKKSKKLFTVTISREYGSGGHEIGKLLAEKLGVSFYDKNIIELTAGQTGFTSDFIHQNEQKLAHALLFELYEQNYAYVNNYQPPLDVLFLVQSKIIREISSKESCVIIGRCANYVLKDKPDCFNIFIHADKNYRRNKISSGEGLTGDVIDKKLEKNDRERANYCMHFTGKNWRDADSYDLTISSSRYSANSIIEIIIKTLEDSGFA